jgi:hypothetical protein
MPGRFFSPEQFVVTYQNSESYAEAAKKLSELSGKKITAHHVQSKAYYYKSRGVMLKEMPRVNSAKVPSVRKDSGESADRTGNQVDGVAT